MVNAFRGNMYDKCSPIDWFMQTIYIFICGFVSYTGLIIARKEQALKIKYGKGICSTDLMYDKIVVRKLSIYGFVGGWVSGALGLGGGTIFNPVMLSLGVPP
jgi:uncharacterized membrane protein YfcA